MEPPSMALASPSRRLYQTIATSRAVLGRAVVGLSKKLQYVDMFCQNRVEVVYNAE